MKLLIVTLVIVTPAVFAQRGPVRVTPAPAARPAARPAPRPVVAPYPVYFAGYYPNPFYYGGGYATAPVPADYGYDPSQGYAPQGYPPPQGYQQSPDYPAVIVNPNYTPETANPVLRDYTNVPVPETPPRDGADQQATAGQTSVFFLIALKDHTIYPAIAYWVEDTTLNYVSQQGVRNRVPLDQVDRDFSTQLNKERNVDFGLPPAK